MNLKKLFQKCDIDMLHGNLTAIGSYSPVIHPLVSLFVGLSKRQMLQFPEVKKVLSIWITRKHKISVYLAAIVTDRAYSEKTNEELAQKRTYG